MSLFQDIVVVKETTAENVYYHNRRVKRMVRNKIESTLITGMFSGREKPPSQQAS